MRPPVFNRCYQSSTANDCPQSVGAWLAPLALPRAGLRRPRGLPQNGQSGRHYHGVNSVLLFLTAQERGYEDARWMTFRQANE
jgi:antirestriction protein ArdC